MLELFIALYGWVCDLFDKKKPAVQSKQVDDGFKFRVVTRYGKFYVEVEYRKGRWDDITFGSDGKVHGSGRGRSVRGYKSKTEACNLAKRLNNGERYFPDYDDLKYAIVDCDCQE